MRNFWMQGAPPSIFRVYPPWRVGLEFSLVRETSALNHFGT
jgi:hypothetical protein